MGRSIKPGRSTSVRTLSSVFGRRRHADPRQTAEELAQQRLKQEAACSSPNNNMKTMKKKTPPVPPLPAMPDPPLSPRASSSPTPTSPSSSSSSSSSSPREPLPSRSPMQGRKFSLPENAYSSRHHHEGHHHHHHASPVSPRRILRSLSASLRALRVYSRTASMTDLAYDAAESCDSLDDLERRRGSFFSSSSSTSSSSSRGSSRKAGMRERRRKDGGFAPTAPISLASFIRDSMSSVPSSSSSSSSAGRSSRVRWGSQASAPPCLEEMSTTETYRVLFGQLAIKVVFHRFRETAQPHHPHLHEEEDEAAGDEAAVSAERLLRKYFSAEQEEKRLEQARRAEVEGDDISIVVFRPEDADGGHLTFEGLVARLHALYAPEEKEPAQRPRRKKPLNAELDQDDAKDDEEDDDEEGKCRFAIFYDDAEGDRVRVRDTSSLLYACRDWRHHQRQAREALREEERQARRNRWREKVAQIELEERAKKRAMLAQVGNMKLMLRAGRRHPAAAAGSDAAAADALPSGGEREEGASSKTTNTEEEEEEEDRTARVQKRKEKQERQARMRGTSLKFHVYEQRLEGRRGAGDAVSS